MRTRAPLARWLLLAPLTALVACGETEPAPPAASLTPAPITEEGAIDPDALPPFPTLLDDSRIHRAPAAFDHLIPRLGDPDATCFSNLLHFALNVQMRGPREGNRYQRSGREIAAGWRRAAASTRGIFAERETLFSQQDHPIDHGVVRIMMPPSWVSVAVDLAASSEPITPMQCPALDDDHAWTGIASARALFGSFPISQRLYEAATKPRGVIAPDRLRVTSARRSLAMLARDVEAMVAASAEGPEAVARAGAERIALSDRVYFGTRVRREHMILILTENPNVHEARDEDRGFVPARQEVSEEAVMIARRAILRRRLQDGAIAIQRYDISIAEERRRAIARAREVLEGNDASAKLWLIVHGGVAPDGSGGQDASPFANGFRAELQAAGLGDRVQLLSVPPVPIGGGELAEKLHVAARRYRAWGLPLNLNIGTPLTLRLLQQQES